MRKFSKKCIQKHFHNTSVNAHSNTSQKRVLLVTSGPQQERRDNIVGPHKIDRFIFSCKYLC